MNVKAGICDDCGQYWTVSGGGLNENHQCPTCADKYPIDNHRENVKQKIKLVGVSEHGRRIGNDHHNCKWHDGLVSLVHGLRDEGMGYKRIAKTAQMPTRTVRDICNGRSRCHHIDHWVRISVEDDG